MGDEVTMESVKALIAEALGKLKGTDDIDESAGRGGKVPWERFDTVNRERKRALEALAALTPKVDALTAQHQAAQQTTKEEAAAAIAVQATTNAEDLALVDVGFDAAGRSALRAHWGGLPEATRGKDVTEWWTARLGELVAHRKDPKTATAPELPKTLAPYLPAPAKATTAPGAQPATATTGIPGIVVGTGLSPNATGVDTSTVADPVKALEGMTT
ncbi:MAG: hypothetical protein GY873_13820, partial [Bosea sp.]|nr:hypothetical protein [Bosea sp. (in: a-proteobacteria)]